MRVLVLGGDGFLGSHVTDALLALGHDVAVFDRFPGGWRGNLAHVQGRVRVFAGDFSDPVALAAALEDQEIVFHFISATNPASSWGTPWSEMEKNIRPTLALLDLAAMAGVRKIVFASSGGTIYGRGPSPFTEDVVPQPFTPYGIGKLAQEYFLGYFREKAGIAVDIFRIGNAYGPRQRTDGSQGVIAAWMEAICGGKRLKVFGESEAQRDYVCVGDIAHLMMLALRDAGESRVFNLGTGRGVTIMALLEIFRKVIPDPFDFEILPGRGFDATSSVLDSSRLLRLVPEFRFTGLEQGIARTWAWWRAGGNEAPDSTERGA